MQASMIVLCVGIIVGELLSSIGVLLIVVKNDCIARLCVIIGTISCFGALFVGLIMKAEEDDSRHKSEYNTAVTLYQTLEVPNNEKDFGYILLSEDSTFNNDSGYIYRQIFVFDGEIMTSLDSWMQSSSRSSTFLNDYPTSLEGFLKLEEDYTKYDLGENLWFFAKNFETKSCQLPTT